MRLGELLLKENVITPQQLQEALAHQKLNGGKLGKALVSLGYARDEEITALLSRRYGVRSVELENLEVHPSVLKLVPAELARKYLILPLGLSEKTLTVAIDDPKNVAALDDVKVRTGYRIEPVVASETALERAIDKRYGSAPAAASRVSRGNRDLTRDDLPSFGRSGVDLDGLADAPGAEPGDRGATGADEDEIDLTHLAGASGAPPVVKLVNVLLVDSLKRGASDIHVEPYETEFRVRLRIDGVLYKVMELPVTLKEPIASRIKAMAKMDIADKRLPQEGRIGIRLRIKDRSHELRFRVSCLPTLGGETIGLRLIDGAKPILNMTKLGFEPASLERFRRALDTGSGLVLLTGPRRSGKTNTLLAGLVSLNRPDLNIVIAGDRIEFDVPGTNQAQVPERAWAQYLPLVLKQDADVLVVGDVKGPGAAEAAVTAALGGHLVLAVMTEPDCCAALDALIEAGIHPSRLARALTLVLTQRLVRRICTDCRTEVPSEAVVEDLLSLGVDPVKARAIQASRGQGCRSCHGTGYRGQTGLFECMPISEPIRGMIAGNTPPLAIFREALAEGMLSLPWAGIEKIDQGITTVEEVLREAGA